MWSAALLCVTPVWSAALLCVTPVCSAALLCVTPVWSAALLCDEGRLRQLCCVLNVSFDDCYFELWPSSLWNVDMRGFLPVSIRCEIGLWTLCVRMWTGIGVCDGVNCDWCMRWCELCLMYEMVRTGNGVHYGVNLEWCMWWCQLGVMYMIVWTWSDVCDGWNWMWRV